MSTTPGVTPPESGGVENDVEAAENAFAGLTALDVIDGELVPRRRRRH